MFRIDVADLCWIDDSKDNSEDLCLHGKVTASIGNQNYEYDCTVSSTALTKNALLC